ncbi:hypothetical protein [Glycomyces xiaoerkulensis]|uniref:hypothetical protein n=1 Tax=Glycomyces xiaoerkulensis TaxID=2038139 RepID=UPI0013000926|nr:hypothetical protein [Glycomyces xiaoerkulensis]
MVSASVRQNPVPTPARNASNTDGTPTWAIPGFRAAPGAPPPASPWDDWVIPPKRPRSFSAARKPSPWPRPETRSASAEHAEHQDHPPQRLAQRLLFVVGFAYLMLSALSAGLVWTGYPAQAEARPRRSDDLPRRDPLDHSRPSGPGLRVRADGSRYLVPTVPVELPRRSHADHVAFGRSR